MPNPPLTHDEIRTCIAAVLGRQPDESLVDYHVGMGFNDAIAFGGYLRSTGEFRSNLMRADGGRKTISTFLGDRVLSYTHMGERIFLMPGDLDLTISILEYGRWEPHVEAAIARVVKDGDVVIEAGANIGYHTLGIARAAGSRGLVHAFEANPQVMKLLRATLFQNGHCDFMGNGRVTLHQQAVADRRGTLVLQAAPDHFGSGHLVTDRPGSDFGDAYSNRFNVEAVLIDERLAGLSKVDCMHLDIEGAEPLAIKGARGLLERSPDPKIILEWSVGMMQALGGVEDMIAWLCARGFRFWVIEPDGQTYTPVGEPGLMSLPHCDVLIAKQLPI